MLKCSIHCNLSFFCFRIMMTRKMLKRFPFSHMISQVTLQPPTSDQCYITRPCEYSWHTCNFGAKESSKSKKRDVTQINYVGQHWMANNKDLTHTICVYFLNFVHFVVIILRLISKSIHVIPRLWML